MDIVFHLFVKITGDKLLEQRLNFKFLTEKLEERKEHCHLQNANNEFVDRKH
jgi:hypothetical protein